MLGLCWGVPADRGVTTNSAALLLPALVSVEWAQGHQGGSRSISRQKQREEEREKRKKKKQREKVKEVEHPASPASCPQQETCDAPMSPVSTHCLTSGLAPLPVDGGGTQALSQAGLCWSNESLMKPPAPTMQIYSA